MRNRLQNKKTVKTCSLTHCPIKDDNICLRHHVVYKILCRHCEKFYIGSTIRAFHHRFIEHTRNKESSVYKHVQQCTNIINNNNNRNNIDNMFTAQIIGSDHDEANLRLREAILISNLKPQLNSKMEMESFREFLFL